MWRSIDILFVVVVVVVVVEPLTHDAEERWYGNCHLHQ